MPRRCDTTARRTQRSPTSDTEVEHGRSFCELAPSSPGFAEGITPDALAVGRLARTTTGRAWTRWPGSRTRRTTARRPCRWWYPSLSRRRSPDLMVGSASVDDSNLNTGDSFTLSATVRNAGDEQSAATTLRYYRSTDVGHHLVGHGRWAPTRWACWQRQRPAPESISLTAPSRMPARTTTVCAWTRWRVSRTRRTTAPSIGDNRCGGGVNESEPDLRDPWT